MCFYQDTKVVLERVTVHINVSSACLKSVNLLQITKKIFGALLTDFPANIRLDEDVLKTSFVFVFRRRLDQDEYVHLSLMSSEDVLVKTNIFVLAVRLQNVFKTFSRHLQDVFKTSSRRFAKTFSRRLQDVLHKGLQDIFKTF